MSPRWDLVWFVGPGLLALATVVALAAWPADTTRSLALRDEWVWILCVLAVDVAHVWASLYRTYLDPDAWVHHRARLLWTPALLLWFGALVHVASPAMFWRALAYVAVFHFVKQHEGFALLYLRAGERAAPQRSAPPLLSATRGRALVRAAMWAGTVGPIVAWHATLPKDFAWFMDGDFVPGLPGMAGALALACAALVLATFVLWRVLEWRSGARNPLLAAVVLIPAANWTTGMVLFDDDAIFTITNVVMHGVPYLALVWRAGGPEVLSRWLSTQGVEPDGEREPEARVPAEAAGVSPSRWLLVAIFYASVLLLAFAEEALWDRWIWHERPWLFGEASGASASRHPVSTSVLVALLTLPQATHYVLDRYIWRMGPDNPQLARRLGFGPPSAGPLP